MEAALVKFHVKNLVDAGVKPEDIAIITPYNAQVRLSLSLSHANPTSLRTVMFFQIVKVGKWSRPWTRFTIDFQYHQALLFRPVSPARVPVPCVNQATEYGMGSKLLSMLLETGKGYGCHGSNHRVWIRYITCSFLEE